uniref:Uncharacterized protein n=1 Tax=Romanomermis culicivorax TaxID=13658 RepID=A0A915K709_ROMCU
MDCRWRGIGRNESRATHSEREQAMHAIQTTQAGSFAWRYRVHSRGGSRCAVSIHCADRWKAGRFRSQRLEAGISDEG